MGHILYYNLHLFFSVFLGLEILLGCGLNCDDYQDECGPEEHCH